MARFTTSDGIEIDYDRTGSEGDPPILLVMGLGAQRTVWPPEMIDALVAEGFEVITFDNRDVGLSTGFDHVDPPPTWKRYGAMLRVVDVEPPYTLGDMARDAVELLDHLDIEAAHVVGASMGGMIAQHVAFDHPGRVRSLVSIMSTTGAPLVGRPTLAAAKVLVTAPPTKRSAYIAHSVDTYRTISSPTLFDPARSAERVAAGYDRSFRPQAGGRHMLAVLDDGDRTDRLARVQAPTLVIHGTEDPLIRPSGGEATAAAIPGARLETIEQMAHDFPLPLIPRVVDLIVDHVRSAGIAA